MKFRIDLKIIIFLILFYFTGHLKIYFVIMFFALLHELAHLIMGKFLGFKPIEFEIIPLGFRISLNPKIEDYNVHILKSNMVQLKYIFVAMAGPIFNLICSILFSHINIHEGDIQEILSLRQILVYSNLLIFLFNLIPIYPLDGGRILKSILRLFMGRKKSNEYMRIISNISAILFTIVGSIAILYLKNIAVLLILVYIWILVIRQRNYY